MVTEKTTDMAENRNKYVFEVALASNKVEVKQAVEKYFGVKVLDVRTLRMHGKPKRQRHVMGHRRNWKKAIVTLKAGDKIEYFEGA